MSTDMEYRVTVPCQACGGRISVTELPNEVGISLEHIEARVEAWQYDAGGGDRR